MKKFQKSERLEFLPVENFVEDFIAEIQKNPRTITMLYFRIRDDLTMQRIRPFLEETIKKGTKVILRVDMMYTYYQPASSFFPARFGKKRRSEKEKQASTRRMLKELQHLGVTIEYLNKPNLFNKFILQPIKRDHRKIIVAEFESNTIAYFGASNIEDGKTNDYMVKVQDRNLIPFLRDIINSYNETLPAKDTTYSYKKEMFYLDVGHMFSSLIFKRAEELIDTADKEIVFVSQLPPEKRLMDKLVGAASRNVKITIISSLKEDRQIQGFPYNIAYYIAKKKAEKAGIQICHSKNGFVHAKILKVDDVVLLGSHNLSSAGVICGTVELSAEIRDTNILSSVDLFIDSLL